MARATTLEREDRDLSLRDRLISALEACLAIFIVVAHNVYHWIPNEVPILFVLAIASFRIREGKWGTFLYRRPKSWLLTVTAAAVCVGIFALKDLTLEAIGHHFWPAPEKVSSVITSAHDWRRALLMTLFVWVFAAFGEEIGYRGYLLRRALEALGSSAWGAASALIIASATFGFGHYYKGPAGVLDSAGSGLIVGTAYILSKRLWVSSLAHGLVDTLAIAIAFFGW